MKQFIRKLQRVSSHSYSINLPKDIISEFRWRERQKLTIEKHKDGIFIKDWKK